MNIKEAIDSHRKELERVLFGESYLETQSDGNPFVPRINHAAHRHHYALDRLPDDGRFYSAHLEHVRATLADNQAFNLNRPRTYHDIAAERSESIQEVMQKLVASGGCPGNTLEDRPALLIPPNTLDGPPPSHLNRVAELSLIAKRKFNFGQAEKLLSSVLEKQKVLKDATDNVVQIGSKAKKQVPQEEPTGVVTRVRDWLTSFLKGGQKALSASWYENQGSFIKPTDPEIKAAVASIYGGYSDRMRFIIQLYRATDVPGMDWLIGTSDPFVEVALVRGVAGISAGNLDALPLLCARKTSSTVYTSNNPQWNEMIELDSVDIVEVLADCVLHVSLWDYDTVGTNDAIGYCSMALIDSLEIGGVAPFPLCPIQGQKPIGMHAGVFVKFELRVQDNVGCLITQLIALQGMESLAGDESIRIEIKVVKGDPLAATSYDSSSVCNPDMCPRSVVQETGHVNLIKVKPFTQLFKREEHNKKGKVKPEDRLFVHLTVTGDGVLGNRTKHGQVAIPLSGLEELQGYKGKKLHALQGNPNADDALSKCRLYFSVASELVPKAPELVQLAEN